MRTWIVIALIAFAGCASVPDSGLASENDRVVLPDDPVDFSFERGSASLAVRMLDEASSINVVLMNGLEFLQVGPYAFENETPSAILEVIATDAHALVHESPDYTFIYPTGYEALLETSPGDSLSAEAPDVTFDIVFGADTPLYDALALLTHSTGYTMIADNAVAVSLCGETHLYDVTIEQALSALFRSARLSPQSIRIDSHASHTFVSAIGNRPRSKLFFTQDGWSGVHERRLKRRVSLSLPDRRTDGDSLQGQIGAKPLAEVLPALSDQLGILVTADANLSNLPVNPAVITDVPLEVALKLIINQWLLPEFGYRLTDEGVHLMHVGAS